MPKGTIKMPSLPRGVQQVEWRNSDRTKQVRYRVRIARKDLTVDRLFDHLDDAKEFLALSKTEHGKKLIKQETDEKQEQEGLANHYKQIFQQLWTNPPLEAYIDKYIEMYVDVLPKETHEQRRIIATKKALYAVLKRTEVPKRNELLQQAGATALWMTGGAKISLGKIPLRDLKPININDYVKARLEQGRKKATVGREISVLSVCFEKLKYIDETLESWKNIAYDFDKSLLVGRVKKRKFRLSEDDENKLLEALENYGNREMKDIVMLSLLTSMRRSEIINLRWDQVKENYIALENTKNGDDREVFLTNEAREYIKSIPIKGEKLFKYKVGGFSGSFQKFLENNNLTHIRFHDFRRESISRLVESVGINASPILAEMLAFSSKRKFRENYIKPAKPENLESLEGIKQNAGHHSDEIHSRYFVVKK